MHALPVIIMGVIAVAALIWMLWGSRTPADSSATADGELLDPADARQMGLLAGQMGGGVADAALYQFALRRFEEIHGRKATTRDVGTVAGMVNDHHKTVRSLLTGPEQ